MRILLIDDDEKFRNELQLWLTQNLKHSVAVAGSVAEARTQLQRDRYHAILLDSHLRNSTDDQVDSNSNGGLEMLKSMFPGQVSKTILVTAHNLDDLSGPALIGCDRFVFKRWRSSKKGQDPDQFHLKIKSHLDQLSAKRRDVFTTMLGGSAIIIVAGGIIWQMVRQSRPVLLAALIGTIVNLLSFLSILLGRPVYLIFRRRRSDAPGDRMG